MALIRDSSMIDFKMTRHKLFTHSKWRFWLKTYEYLIEFSKKIIFISQKHTNECIYSYSIVKWFEKGRILLVLLEISELRLFFANIAKIITQRRWKCWLSFWWGIRWIWSPLLSQYPAKMIARIFIYVV